MKNIISNLVMLIDLYYYRKRIMIRWRSIKHYQRAGKIKFKITKGKYPSYQIPISPNPPKPTKKIVESRVRQAPQPPPRPRSASILSEEFKELLKQKGVQVAISGFEANAVLKIEITYKNMNRILQFTDQVSKRLVEEAIYRALDQIDVEIGKELAMMSHKGIDLQKPYKSYSEYKYK